jgi:hypothetical protein
VLHHDVVKIPDVLQIDLAENQKVVAISEVVVSDIAEDDIVLEESLWAQGYGLFAIPDGADTHRIFDKPALLVASCAAERATMSLSVFLGLRGTVVNRVSKHFSQMFCHGHFLQASGSTSYGCPARCYQS